MWQKTTSVILVLIVVGLAFGNIGQIFFQQDEWLSLGNALAFRAQDGVLEILKSNFWPNSPISRVLPLTGLTNYVVFNTFKFNPWAYGLLAVGVASLNAILLYLILQKWLDSHIVGILVTSLWITNNLAVQSITWIGTFIPSQFSVLFFLLAWMAWQRQKLWLTVGLMWTSLWYKEMAPFYIVLFSAIAWTEKRLNRRTLLILSIPLVIMLGLPKLVNLIRHFAPVVSPAIEPVSYENISYNLWLLPARTLAHIFLPTSNLYKIFYKVSNIHYGAIADGHVVESVVGDAFSLLVSFYILFAILGLSRLKNAQTEVIWLSLLVFFVSVLPYTLFNDQNAILEPRYYVYPALTAYLMAVVSIHGLLKSLPIYNHFVSILLILFFLPLLKQNIVGVQASLYSDIQTGQYRRQILNTIDVEIKNSLKKNNIFLFSAPGGGFYDFQSGFGQTLAVWFYGTGKIPIQALRDKDLWDLNYEGLKDFNGQKYGYFMHYEKLTASLQQNPDLSPNDVIAFSWNSQNHTVSNITLQIRESLLIK